MMKWSFDQEAEVTEASTPSCLSDVTELF